MAALTLAVTTLLIPQALSKALLSPAEVLYTPYTSLILTTDLVRRQDASTINQTDLLNPDGSLNMTAFANATDSACQSTLAKLSQASNPSGMSICYNLPSLNTKDGVFEADLRLYRVSDPRGAWVQVNTSQIDVNVGFSSAKVSSATEKDIASLSTKSRVVKRQNNAGSKSPELLQSYMLVGQITSSKISANTSMAALEALVMPTLNLTAPTPSRNLSTTLSPNEAAFLTGVFSDKAPLSSFSAAQAAVDLQLSRLQTGNGTDPDVAFVLPGTQLLIFPIGLIITGSWALLGVAAYGFGTVERWRFRQVYRERARLIGKMGRRPTRF